MQNFPTFAMNKHYNLQAFSHILIVIMAADDILALLKGYASDTDDISMILTLFFMYIYNCARDTLDSMQKNTEISDLLIFWLWLVRYIQLQNSLHTVQYEETGSIVICLIKDIGVLITHMTM